MDPRDEAELRQRLWTVRLARAVAHARVVRESAVTRRLHAEVREVEDESRRVRRHARWLVRTGQPLPRVVHR